MAIFQFSPLVCRLYEFPVPWDYLALLGARSVAEGRQSTQPAGAAHPLGIPVLYLVKNNYYCKF